MDTEEAYVIMVPNFSKNNGNKDYAFMHGSGWQSSQGKLNAARIFPSEAKARVALRHMHVSNFKIVKVSITLLEEN